ncbi:hypothetical protein QOT17_024866 [Balamuthia mandrillaris]
MMMMMMMRKAHPFHPAGVYSAAGCRAHCYAPAPGLRHALSLTQQRQSRALHLQNNSQQQQRHTTEHLSHTTTSTTSQQTGQPRRHPTQLSLPTINVLLESGGTSASQRPLFQNVFFFQNQNNNKNKKKSSSVLRMRNKEEEEADFQSELRHIEVTDDAVRLEFSETNQEYKDLAALMYMTEEEREERRVPDWLVPINLENRVYCGGGATVFLDKNKVTSFLVQRHQQLRPQQLPSAPSSTSSLFQHSNKE